MLVTKEQIYKTLRFFAHIRYTDQQMRRY